MENHHFYWENPLFRLGHFQLLCQLLPEGIHTGFHSKCVLSKNDPQQIWWLLILSHVCNMRSDFRPYPDCDAKLPCHVEPLSLLVSVLSPLLFVVPPPMLRLCSIMSWWKPWSPTYLLAETPWFAAYLYPIAILCMISTHSGCMYIIYI